MTTRTHHEGDVILYTAPTDIKSGDVLAIGSNGDAIMGIALEDIASGEKGAVSIRGAWEVPKVSAAVIKAGEGLIWDSSEGAFEDNQATPAAGDVSGAAIAIEDAGATVTKVMAKLNVSAGTLT